MTKEILFEASRATVPLLVYLYALFAGLLFYFVSGLVVGFLAAGFILVCSFMYYRDSYVLASKNPILLNFEGIHCNVITQELGGEWLPWEAVSEILECSQPKTGEKFIQVNLAPGLYSENWRKLKYANRLLEPGYTFNAKAYDAEHDDMLYWFRSYHEEFGQKDIEYKTLNADPELGEPSNLRLTVAAIFGYGVIIYSLITGRFPIAIGRAISVDVDPGPYWLMIIAFFLIASWAAREFYINYSTRRLEDSKEQAE